MKKTRRLSIFASFLFSLFTLGLMAQTNPGLDVTNDESGFIPEGYQLDWSDEVEGNELNTNDWKFEIHDPGWVNNELQR